MNKKKLIEQMKHSVHGKLPAGIIDENVEFFAEDDQVFAIMDGDLKKPIDWPAWLLEAIEKDMAKNPEAVDALVELGLDQRLDMIIQYIKCRYSVLDNDPDVVNRVLQDTEYVSCELRGSCPFEGKLCELFKAPFGVLTHREIQVLRLIAEGLLDKEIADQLGVSSLTVPVHTRNLRTKIGARNRSELIRFAYDHNLL